jgi:cell division septum initiation protein DivIVA
MSDFDSPEATIDEPMKRRTAGSRFAELSDRLARAFGGIDEPNGEPASWESGGGAEDQAVTETPELWDPVAHRFPIARRGYDRAAVDARITELERELDELKGRAPMAVSQEIERIGEQTAAILSTAHDQAQETLRRAQAQADLCIANAASNAVAITQGASRQLRELDGETDSVWRERARLIDDVRNVATALLSLAGEAADRFPAEPERAWVPVPGSSAPDGERVWAPVAAQSEPAAENAASPAGGAQSSSAAPDHRPGSHNGS